MVVAFDGSTESEAAMRAAAELFGAHPLVIVSVWEPGLAVAMAKHFASRVENPMMVWPSTPRMPHSFVASAITSSK